MFAAWSEVRRRMPSASKSHWPCKWLFNADLAFSIEQSALKSFLESDLEASIEIEIANRFSGRRILGFLHLLFELFRQDVFLVGFLKPGIREFVFTRLFLFFQNVSGLRQVHIGPWLYMRFVRQHRPKHRTHHQLALAPRAGHIPLSADFQSNAFLVPPRGC